jgi:hypothetical protein
MRASRQPWWLLWSALALVQMVAADARANPQAYRRAVHATGWVVAPRDEGIASGTCWVADRARRLAVTCRHVVGDADEVLVYFPRYEQDRPIVEAAYYLKNVRAVVGRVVATDAGRDLALLRLRSLPPGVEELPLAATGSGPGDDVHSVGNSGLHGGLAEGTLWWYTRGCVRQVHRRPMRTPAGPELVRMVETQSPVNEGDSGGPVVDDQGRLVGVTDSYTAGERLVSQSIDVAEVRAFLRDAPVSSADKDAGRESRLHGGWTMQAKGKAKDKGTGIRGEWEFRTDGTFIVSGRGRSSNGRYVYANGMLWLVLDDVLALARPTWSGSDRFTLKADGKELAFERRLVNKTAAEGGAKKAPGGEKAASSR